MDSLGPFLLGLLISAGFLAPGIYFFWRHDQKAKQQRKALGQQVIQLQEVLVGVPDGLYRWNIQNGVENCSARMAVLLDLPDGTKSRYPDILSRLDDDGARSLDRAVQALHRDGTTFDLLVPLRDASDRIIQAVGQRVLGEDATPLVDLLWMRLASDAIMDNGPVARELQEALGARDKLITVLENLPTPVWVRDAAGQITYRNPATIETDFSHGLAAKALETGREVKERISLPTVQGRFTFDALEIPLPNGEGTMGTAQDVSSLADVMENAQRGEHVLRGALENLVTAIAIFGGDTRLNYYNHAYAMMWGLEKNWLDSQPGYGEILDRLRETRRLPEYANFRAYRQEQLAKFVELQVTEEYTLHLPDNSTLRAITSPHPVSGLVMTFEDVSDTVALETSNKSLTAVQRETLDKLFEGVIVFGANGRVKLFNPAFLRIWHLEADFLQAQPHISEVLEACKQFYEGVEEWPVFRDKLAARFMKREPENLRVERSDGSILEYASVPLPDGGSLLCYLDVSANEMVEQAKKESSNAQHVADRMKSEFIANVSYEIRTPLTTLMGFADLMCEEYFGTLNKRQKEYAAGIQKSAQHLHHLIADILDLATIEADQVELEHETVDIQELLVSVLGLIRESAKNKQITLEFNCPQDIGWMTADLKRLKQVLFNILTNAVRHTPVGGTIMISAGRSEDQISLSVADNGEGIAPQDKDAVFNSFVRTPATTSTERGAGLGLTLAKNFIELHGGHITLDSIPAKGTVVTCHLPLKKAP